MLADVTNNVVRDEDHLALAAACQPGVGLCTIVGIDGSFSRRLGAQLAILPDGSTVGDLADSCLESQLAADIGRCAEPRVVRYGRGSSKIDFRLPCGGGLDILLDPSPDRKACRSTLEALQARRPARLALGGETRLRSLAYLPALKLVVLGEGPELEAVASLCSAIEVEVETFSKDDLVLGQAARKVRYDPWTACLLLFHDHEWELALLQQALESEAFYIGAQGGAKARADRTLALAARGVPEEQIARLTSPVGLLPACKSARTLALSARCQKSSVATSRYVPATELKTGVVLLAAGQGKRFGGGKLTADFRGRPLWEWAAETAEGIDFSERLLVIGPNSPIRARPDWRLVDNPVAEQGIGTSIAAGVRSLTDCDRVIIMLADMPLVSRTHLGRLFLKQGVAFTRFPHGSAGCPAIFPRSVFPLLDTLNGDRGARSLNLGDAELIAPPHEGQLADVDEVCDLQQLSSAD